MDNIKDILITEEQRNALYELGFKDEDINPNTLVNVALYKEALKGNVSAINTIKGMLDFPDGEDLELRCDITDEVEEEEKRILSSLKNLSKIQLELNSELIHNLSFQSVLLRHLRMDISKNGVKEKYKNGATQWGYKDRTEVKAYNSVVKSYQSCLKQLNALLDEDSTMLLDDDKNPFI